MSRNVAGDGDVSGDSIHGECPETFAKGLTGNNAGIMENSLSDKRQYLSGVARSISLLTQELKPYHNRTSTVKSMYVKRFGDAYRFMLKLCNGQSVTTVHKGGYVAYKVELPGNAGTLELKPKYKCIDKETVAVLVFDTESPDIAVKEIRFLKE